MPSSLGPAEILVILVVALIVLGPTRLPQAGRQVGRALAEVRRWSRGVEDELRDALNSEPEPPRVPTPPSVEGNGSATETLESPPPTTSPPSPERPRELVEPAGSTDQPGDDEPPPR